MRRQGNPRLLIRVYDRCRVCRGPGAAISRVDISIIFKCAARVKQRRETVGTGNRDIPRGGGKEGSGNRTEIEGARAAWYAAAWCCRLTYLSAATPPATGPAASAQSAVLPICIPDPATAQFAARSPFDPRSLFASLSSTRFRPAPTEHRVTPTSSHGDDILVDSRFSGALSCFPSPIHQRCSKIFQNFQQVHRTNERSSLLFFLQTAGVLENLKIHPLRIPISQNYRKRCFQMYKGSRC